MVLCSDLHSTRSKGDPQTGWVGVGLGYLQEGRFLHIFMASVRIMKPFSSLHFILHKQPFHQMCLTKPLKQPRMPLTRQAGDGQVSQTTRNTAPLFQAPTGVPLLPTTQRCPTAGNHPCCPKRRREALVFLVSLHAALWLLLCAAKQTCSLPSDYEMFGPVTKRGEQKGATTIILLRLTSSRSGSLLCIRFSVSSTSVEFGSSSGTGLYCVGLITPASEKRDT